MPERCNCDASCGENRYHNVGDRECRYRDDDAFYKDHPAYQTRPTTQDIFSVHPKPTYHNKHIDIPNIGMSKPEDYSMVLKVSEAMQINQDLADLLVEKNRMKIALNNIFASSNDPVAIRRAAIGLGLSE